MSEALDERTVVLGVTGGIGAYKACELARLLVKRGHRVKAVMTEAATHFVGPLTLRTLTGNPVAVGMWEDSDAPVRHVSLAEEADALVIAPCTANVLAKLAQGRADDLLTTTVLATEATLVIAPAMNTHMWRKESTQAAVATLRARGAVIVEPPSGELACGTVGEGRLAEPAVIAEAVEVVLARSRDLEGARVLVTAGGTREPIDAVRFIGNRSSGKTGYAIAEEAARRGAKVTLVSGPSALPDPFGCDIVRVETATQMREAVLASFDDADAVVMSAAVADFRPVEAAAGKMKKDGEPEALRLESTQDVLAELGARKGGRVLVGFAAETEDVLGNARGKLGRKRLDLIVANDVSRSGLGFDSDDNEVVLVTADGAEELPRMHKRALAGVLCDRLAALLEARRTND
ncbi:MAG: bifunctional phosphopantothenoylcysteine decarboxylase/phosphopantothenate--cysteine ligase CoaBC [Coriobacteriia bacterium]